jgi:hypothetical protein
LQRFSDQDMRQYKSGGRLHTALAERKFARRGVVATPPGTTKL